MEGRDVWRERREEEEREGKSVMEGMNGPLEFKTWMRQC